MLNHYKKRQARSFIYLSVFIIMVSLFILIILLINGKDLDYEVLFDGFITVDFEEEYMSIISEPIVFNSKDEWDSFGSEYLANHYEEIFSYIALFGGINFEEESMLYYSIINPKSWYDDAKEINSISIKYNKIHIKYSSNRNNCVTVLNPSNIKHPYIYIAKINKNKIPNDLENLYNEEENYYY